MPPARPSGLPPPPLPLPGCRRCPARCRRRPGRPARGRRAAAGPPMPPVHPPPLQPAARATAPAAAASSGCRVSCTAAPPTMVVAEVGAAAAPKIFSTVAMHGLVGDARPVMKMPGLDQAARRRPPARWARRSLPCPTGRHSAITTMHGVVQHRLAPGVQRIGHVQRLQQPLQLGRSTSAGTARRWPGCRARCCGAGSPRSTGTMALPSALPACKVATRVSPVTSARAMMSTWASKMSEKYCVLVGVLGVALQRRPQLLDRGQRSPSPPAASPAASRRATGRGPQRASASRCWVSLPSSLADVARAGRPARPSRRRARRASRW